MCPACIASTALIAGGVLTSGGLTALVGKMFHTKKNATTNGLANPAGRRNDYGDSDEQERTFEGGATS